MVVYHKIWACGEPLPTKLKRGVTFKYHLIE